MTRIAIQEKKAQEKVTVKLFSSSVYIRFVMKKG